jgi:hypothetical protein
MRAPGYMWVDPLSINFTAFSNATKCHFQISKRYMCIMSAALNVIAPQNIIHVQSLHIDIQTYFPIINN